MCYIKIYMPIDNCKYALHKNLIQLMTYAYCLLSYLKWPSICLQILKYVQVKQIVYCIREPDCMVHKEITPVLKSDSLIVELKMEY